MFSLLLLMISIPPLDSNLGSTFVESQNDELKFNITRRVKLATISWGWTYSEGYRDKRVIRVHEGEFQAQSGYQNKCGCESPPDVAIRVVERNFIA